MITQNLTSTGISTMATENLSVSSILLLDVAKVTVPDELADEDNYDGIDWKRLPNLQKPHHSLKRTPSFIYKYGYRCQSRIKLEQIIFICKYCHQHKILDYGGPGRYDISNANTAAQTHLAKNTPGHGYDKNGKITFESRKRKQTVLEQLQASGQYVSQEAANAIISGFNASTFKQAAIDWLTENNHLLREFETPSFCHMIQIANPEAEHVLWLNHQAVADYILAEYEAYLPSVTKALAAARSLLHISFDGWQTPNGKLALTGIYTHHLDEKGHVVDYMLALPAQLGQHSGINYAEVIGNVLDTFKITKERLGYFVTDNASTNDTCLDYLGAKFGFNKAHRHARCACHILNLVAQQFMFGKNKESFENKNTNIPEEEFLEQWRKKGPLGTLCDLINSINTPQLVQLFE
jgi:hypothetical protein